MPYYLKTVQVCHGEDTFIGSNLAWMCQTRHASRNFHSSKCYFQKQLDVCFFAEKKLCKYATVLSSSIK